MTKNQEKNTINQIIYQNKIKYSINDIDQTASVIGCKYNLHKIIIPNSIQHESKEYTVISISKRFFRESQLKSIGFSSESKLQTIEEEAFNETSISSITIPSEVRILIVLKKVTH